jgi:hypothetical protein
MQGVEVLLLPPRKPHGILSQELLQVSLLKFQVIFAYKDGGQKLVDEGDFPFLHGKVFQGDQMKIVNRHDERILKMINIVQVISFDVGGC